MDQLISYTNSLSKKDIAKIAGAAFGCYVTGKITVGWIKKQSIKSKIREKKEECNLSCNKLEEHVDQAEISLDTRNLILRLSIAELQQKLQSGELKAVDVIHVYQLKALEVNRKTNSICEPIWEAEELAMERDLSTKKKGLLHGLPVSIKENYYIKGYDCTVGISSYIGHPVTEDAVLVKVLKKQGAVPFVRTNIPQTMLTFECSNPIYGQTCNPHDKSRTPGGSSGGEGSLIGGKGSVLGFGSDIGGSIRIPANMCGCCGLKPTFGRLSCKGTHKLGKGQKLVSATTGPMAQEVDGLVLAMKAVLVPLMYELDPTIPPLPFNNEVFESKKKLRIGFYVHDGYIQSVSAMHRAVHIAKDILSSKGHEVVQYQPPDVKKMFKLFLKNVVADGGTELLKVLGNDLRDPVVSDFFNFANLPGFFNFLLSFLAGVISRDDVCKEIVSSMVGLRSVGEYWKLAVDIDKYKEEMLQSWRALGLDAVICPGFACPALPPHMSSRVFGGVGYTLLYNLVNYPAGTIPVTKVTTEDVQNMKNYPSTTMYEKYIKKLSDGSVGLPCGVQCVALPFQEELVLRVMKEVEDGLKQTQTV